MTKWFALKDSAMLQCEQYKPSCYITRYKVSALKNFAKTGGNV
jgi:hypothetical protein